MHKTKYKAKTQRFRGRFSVRNGSFPMHRFKCTLSKQEVARKNKIEEFSSAHAASHYGKTIVGLVKRLREVKTRPKRLQKKKKKQGQNFKT